MENKELRKLKRIELLEIMIEQSKQIDELKEQLRIATEKLAEKELIMKEAGSIAEASLRINKVFEAAQEAADQYLKSIKKMT